MEVNPRRKTVNYEVSENLPLYLLVVVDVSKKKTSSLRVFFCYIR